MTEQKGPLFTLFACPGVSIGQYAAASLDAGIVSHYSGITRYSSSYNYDQ